MPRLDHTAVIESKSEVIEPDRCRTRQVRKEELVYRVRSGDKDAFDELVEPHVSFMQYRVRSILQTMLTFKGCPGSNVVRIHQPA